MPKAKKKLLPKDFEALLEKGDVGSLRAVFDTCDVNARGGYSKQTALAFAKLPEDLARWLVGQGADIRAVDDYGYAPLHKHAERWSTHIALLLELGADVHQGEGARGTPLHSAADSYNADAASILLNHGARVDALNREGRTPLVHALERCGNIDIERMVEVADLLLRAGAKRTPQTKEAVTRIGTNFEFHRGRFNPDSVEAVSAALDKLYAMFEVAPIPRRITYDGKSPIIAKAERPADRHQELWELLVPSEGRADTVQGEVIRISGRIDHEVQGNGGVNWDADFRKMADAFLALVASGVSLPDGTLSVARRIIANLKRRGDGDGTEKPVRHGGSVGGAESSAREIAAAGLPALGA